MKKQLLNVHSRFFSFWKKYRNLYARLGKMLRSGEFSVLSEKVQRNYQRKLDIYYRKVMSYRMIKAAKVSFLAAGFVFLSEAMMAQTDSVWVTHPSKDFPVVSFYLEGYGSTLVDMDNDGDLDIIQRVYDRNTGDLNLELWKQTNNPKERFVKDWDFKKPSLGEISSNWNSFWLDYDEDGDLDVLDFDIFNGTSSVKVVKNIGDFEFTEVPEADNPFANFANTSRLILSDVDLDGDMDVLRGKYISGKVDWELLENTSGKMGEYVLGVPQTAPFVNVPPGQVHNQFSVYNANSDVEKLDQLFLLKGSKAFLFDNDIANSGEFIAADTLDFGNYLNSVVFYDLDEDGDLDIVGSDYYGTGVCFIKEEDGFRKDTTDFFTPGRLYLDDNLDFVDLDGDGDMDMQGIMYDYATYQLRLEAYENIGELSKPKFLSTFKLKENVFDTFDVGLEGRPDEAFLINLDQDEQLEAIYRFSNKLLYYDFNGEEFVKKDVLGSIFNVSETISNFYKIQALDWDGDSDRDLYISAKDVNNVVHHFFIENQGDLNNPNWVLLEGANSPLNSLPTLAADWRIKFIDVNGDGKQDVVKINSNPASYILNTSDDQGYSWAPTALEFPKLNSRWGNNFCHIDGDDRLDVISSYGYFEYSPVINVNEKSLFVDENIPLSSLAGTLGVEYYGADSLKISIISGNDRDLFQLVEGTDTLKVKGALDYEVLQSISLEVKAVSYIQSVPDVWTEDKTATGTVTVNIVNVNDNAPVFRALAKGLNVDENAPKGQELFTLTAIDNDGNLNPLRFSSEDNRITVDAESGVVIVNNSEAFDYEVAETLSFKVKVSDGEHETAITASVALNNQNDNAPVFDALPENLNVDENPEVGAELLTVSATDADGDLNTLTYSTEDTKVAVDASTGKVTVKDASAFDFERAQTVSFDVEVSDGLNKAVQTVTIKVNNLNDNTPKFDDVSNVLSINENAEEGTELVVVSVTDADGDLNPLSFSTDDVNVAVDATSGKVTVKDGSAFDYEKTQSVNFTIKVSDGTHQATKNISVAVNNLNDNIPVIEPLTSELSIDENAQVSATIVELAVSDLDKDVLVFTSSNPDVAVDANGKVEVANAEAFDYETHKSIAFSIEVFDGVHKVSEDYSVALVNLNDNLPVIEAISTDLMVDENAQVSTTIVELSVKDLDNDVLSFNSSNPAIAVNANGKVEVAISESFDFEEQKSIDFAIEVFDGKHKVTENYTVELNNLNDNNPVFEAIADNLNVDENSNQGTELLTLSATDADGDLNNLSFTSEYENVAVDVATGKVTITNATVFDFETVQSISFDVQVSDGTNTATETVVVALNNVNDNVPAFVAIADNLNVDENAEEGTELVILSATDADGALNALSFSTEDAKVAVDATTGKVTVNDVAAFDFETEQSISFDVKVSDGTNNATETVTIALNNLNDNAPIFDKDSYQVLTADTVANGTALLQLSASDVDNMEALAYSLVEASDLFNLSTEGELTVKDFSLVDSDQDTAIYTLTAKVSDTEYTDEAVIVVKVDITTGLFTVYRALDLEMYPNPANNLVNIIVPQFSEEGTITIYAANGQKVLSQVLSTASQQIDVSDLVEGIYIVKVQSGQRTESKRLIVE